MGHVADQERLREWIAREITRHGPDLDRFVLQGHGPDARGVVAQALISDYVPKKPKKGLKKVEAVEPEPEPAPRLEIDREIANYLYSRATAEAKALKRAGRQGPYRFSVVSFTASDDISERYPVLIDLPDDGTGIEEDSGVGAQDLVRLVKESHNAIIAQQRVMTEGFESVITALKAENKFLRDHELDSRKLEFEYREKMLRVDVDIDARTRREKRNEDLFAAGKAAFDKMMGMMELSAKVKAAGTTAQPLLPAVTGAVATPTNGEAPKIEGTVSNETLANVVVQMAGRLDQMTAKMHELDQLAALVKGMITPAGPST